MRKGASGSIYSSNWERIVFIGSTGCSGDATESANA